MKRFTVIRDSGRVDIYENTSYFWVLRNVYADMQSGGSTYDHPNILLLNGKVVIPEGLANLAWEYCRELDDAIMKTTADIQNKHDKGFDDE
ncbi:hypothetical protein PQB35_gp34 [Ochrobactrum phage vB_OspP_OH]|uniref:Uncharacterized protein n=1 Tax=Ochrobactrum phage vB_OspP_OH TaxID=2712957 RepID=A0A6G6XYA4_9CAUD|nr:hypothetical protein PQB35_gp34 [Ochrobactrum phage vB_OspP_OH]QIG66090.1 hypothetical protein phiOH_p34 [Ochrobactrum phage vB_OspP_OH]